MEANKKTYILRNIGCISEQQMLLSHFFGGPVEDRCGKEIKEAPERNSDDLELLQVAEKCRTLKGYWLLQNV